MNITHFASLLLNTNKTFLKTQSTPTLEKGHSEGRQRVLMGHYSRFGGVFHLGLKPLCRRPVLVVRGLLIAALTALPVGALVAVPPNMPNGSPAEVAGGSRLRIKWVVQVVQDHQRRVLGPPQRVELVVAELAHLKEGVPGVHKRRDHYLRVGIAMNEVEVAEQVTAGKNIA
mmetsp:Transcript_3165/g.4375  ORF Transcript_3165/g.4375 Transcript_3165/m.4375 type:complete len:172 (-) Transcript_3165:4442-4957(-)